MFFDIARITTNNGWAMAVTGAWLVMLGLASLSLIISQLHKIIAFFEKQTTPEAPPWDDSPPKAVADVDYLGDQNATAKLYQALSEELGESFDLAKLYQLAYKDNLPHPHLTLRSLRESGLLVPAGDGTFTWNVS